MCLWRRSREQTLFQFTPLREGRLSTGRASGSSDLFQFTPLREGRRKPGENPEPIPHISIHAPAGGATLSQLHWLNVEIISIHAPAGGATKDFRGDIIREIFQFTPLREGRPDALSALTKMSDISIHAPAGGATGARAAVRVHWCNFNSRPCGRGDRYKFGCR